MVSKGQVYWFDFGQVLGSGPGYVRPCVVIQSEAANRSAIRTVIVCLITSNLGIKGKGGNILLNVGEGNLPKESVANVSQVFTLDKEQLVDPIGQLSLERVDQIVNGVIRMLRPKYQTKSEVEEAG
ncbi:MAG: type II toxin-antitoxin system PemK/MazF family toxin [Chthonomonadales bacterium]